jgi:hypothetical protein
MSRPWPRLLGVRWILVLALGVILRLPGLSSPPWDAHLIRQCDTANTARIMARDGIDLLAPRISWGGALGGTVESELPIYNAGVALGWMGRPDGAPLPWAWPRLLSLAAWVAAALLLVGWLRRCGRRDPWAELLLFAAAPLAVRAGRNVQPDMLGLALALIAPALGADAASRGPGRRSVMVLGAGVGLALALSVKLTLLAFTPALLWPWRRRPLELLSVLALSGLGAACWYLHAHGLAIGGVSFGIWGSGAGKWGGPELWGDLATWRAVVGPALARNVPPLAVVLALPTLVAAARREPLDDAAGSSVLAVLGAALLVVAATPGVALHDYYLLPLVPFASVAAADGVPRAAAYWTHRAGSRRFVLGVGLGFAILATAFLLVRDGWSWLRLDLRTPRIAQWVQPYLPAGPGVVVDEHGSCLAFALDRPGWRREVPEASDLDARVREGATWVLVTSHVSGGSLPSSLRESVRGPGFVLLVP